MGGEGVPGREGWDPKCGSRKHSHLLGTVSDSSWQVVQLGVQESSQKKTGKVHKHRPGGLAISYGQKDLKMVFSGDCELGFEGPQEGVEQMRLM